ncbi:MAG: response regulator [Anaerolineae bacterium]|nr:response regulator [Anaerolineae bacterium]
MARILMIDDSPEMLAMLNLVFENRSDYEIVLAKSGEEGLALAFEAPPDIALVDIMMPRMDGYEVVRQLRAHAQTSRIRIIVLTARGQPVDETAALQAGADMHIAKPVSIDVLSNAVESLLTRVSEASTQAIILPVLGLRGGVGVTTLAVNLAVLLQQMGSTVLWDLSPSSGHAALFLGLQPRTHWGFHLRDATKPVSSLLREHKSGLRLLAAPPIPGMFGWFTEADVEALLPGLTATAQFLVIDMPPTLDPALGPIFERARTLLLVTGDDPPAIQTTLATLQALQRWQTRVIVAHNASRPGKLPDAGTLERAMRVTIHSDIPYDPNQRLTLSRGTPLALAKPESPMVSQLKATVQLLLPG